MHLNLTLVQPDLVWENKSRNFELIETMLNGVRTNPDLIILPEMFNTGFSMNVEPLAETMDGNSINWLRKISLKYKSKVLGSLIIKEKNKFFNRLVCLNGQEQIEYYDKRHLFVLSKENEIFSAGYTRKIIQINNWKILILICFDLRFPNWSFHNSEKIPEFDLIIYVANWPETRIYAWQTLLKARAIENQSFVIGVNRVGIDGNNIKYNGKSLIIDPLGNPLLETLDSASIHSFELDKSDLNNVRKKYPFLKSSLLLNF